MPMLRLAAVLAACVTACAWGGEAVAGATKEPLVFLLFGQSNMVGRGDGAKLPQAWRMSPANVTLVEAGRSGPPRPRGKDGAGDFGPEIAFGFELAKAYPERPILLVKHAVGGTSLAKDWDPDRKEGLYAGLLKAYREATKDRPHTLAAALFAQGGADARDEDDAKAYGARLKALIERLRKDLNAPALPFLFSGARPEDPASEDLKSRFKYLTLIREGYVAAERDVPRARMVSTVGLTYNPDGIHYDTAGQLEFGTRYARAYLKEYAAGAKTP
ncbi:MAG: sialate O-acetylesterase [Planctomycetota bacterium]|nr:sialate O-acetylesterase [Planctomycetota bacterium]